jgi:transcriptional regulator with XRE-family HTH domain
MIANNISKNLKYLRKKKGMTQIELRSHLGFTRSTWSNYENGLTNPSIEDLIRFSSFFGVSLDDLILNDLEAKDPSKEQTGKSARKPVTYATNNELSITSEPQIVYLLKEIKKLQEDVNIIKGSKKKDK